MNVEKTRGTPIFYLYLSILGLLWGGLNCNQKSSPDQPDASTEDISVSDTTSDAEPEDAADTSSSDGAIDPDAGNVCEPPCNPDTEQCINSKCLLLQGQPCQSDNSCTSGYCTDGYCCGSRCDDLCEACNLSTQEGVCSAIPNGEADQNCGPDKMRNCCVTDDSMTCLHTGKCSGVRGQCQLFDESTVCVPEACLGDEHTPAQHCDGEGNCVFKTPDYCTPFKCDETNNICFESCLNNEDCMETAECVDSLCGLKDEQDCTEAKQCAHHGCCLNKCKDIEIDPVNCGSCGTVCKSEHASSTTCTKRMCEPVCEPGYAVCDGHPENGCTTNVNEWVNECSRATLVGNKDGNDQDGNQWCCSFFVCGCPHKVDWKQFGPWVTSNKNQWFWAKALWNTDCEGDKTLHHQITLIVPGGVTYKLCLYQANRTQCSALPQPTCVEVTGGTQQTLKMDKLFGTRPGKGTSFEYLVSVQWVSGATCDDKWRLMFQRSRCDCGICAVPPDNSEM